MGRMNGQLTGRLSARLTPVCAVLLMASALSLVTSRYQARQLFVEQEQLAAQARDLDVEWRRLQLARSEFARAARVDDIARQQLKMRPITPEQTLYLPASAQPGLPNPGGAR